MTGPRTTKEALIAELLGDIGTLLDRVDQSKIDVEAMRLAVERGLEQSLKRASADLVTATEKFGAVTTRGVDDFVAVANETLSKFVQQTNNVKASLDSLAQRQPNTVAALAEPAQDRQSKEKGNHQTLVWWVGPIVFGTGMICGICLALLLLK